MLIERAEAATDVGWMVLRAPCHRCKHIRMPAPSTRVNRTKELNDRAVRKLLAAHATSTDEPLLLAVRYKLEDPDIYLLEVIEGFPGEADEPPLCTDFAPSADLRILGTLHLALLSPEQLRSAIERDDELIQEVRRDSRLELQAPEVGELVEMLGVSPGVSSSEKKARLRLLDELGDEGRPTGEKMDEIRLGWRR